jgi:hypothetical protein
MEYYDKCAVDKITEKLKKEDYKFSALILEVTKSTPFQMRRGEQAPNNVVAARATLSAARRKEDEAPTPRRAADSVALPISNR